MRGFVLAVLAVLVLSGCELQSPVVSAPATQPNEPVVAAAATAAAVARGYERLTLMTKEPVYVDPALAMLCKGASQQMVAEAAKRSGPHAHTEIRVFMNAPAAEAFGRSANVYPVGAIVVKEKRGLTFGELGKEPMRHVRDGVGGMIKRPPGYDAGHGDWEYFYFEDDSTTRARSTTRPTLATTRPVESGRITSCVQCHAGAAGTDYVFGGWARGRGE